jgi:hypothetical protein
MLSNVITMIPAPGWRVFDCIWDNGGACYEMPVVGFAGMVQDDHFINKIVVWDDELREAFTLDDDLICCGNTHFVVVPPGVGPEDTEKLKQEGIERAHRKVKMDEAREEGIAEATPKVLAALLSVHPHGLTCHQLAKQHNADYAFPTADRLHDRGWVTDFTVSSDTVYLTDKGLREAQAKYGKSATS